MCKNTKKESTRNTHKVGNLRALLEVSFKAAVLHTQNVIFTRVMIVVELPVPDQAVTVPTVLQPHPVLQPDACAIIHSKGGKVIDTAWM